MQDYVKPAVLSLKGNPQLGGEVFIQKLIAQDPSVLNLGSLVCLERERIQPGAGRLDLLLKDPEEKRWYEVEVQLGATDESHIIRTIEYWDNERKRYPEREHVAVIVAEKITSRFFNVISLFNHHIPLIAIQLTALEVGGKKTIVFTRILDLPDQKPLKKMKSTSASVDKGDWSKEHGPTTLKIASEVQSLLSGVSQGAILKFNKNYIGVAVDGQVTNSLMLAPRHNYVRLSFKMEQTPEWDSLIKAAGLNADYDPVRHKYRFRLVEGTVGQHKSIFEKLIAQAHKEATVDAPAEFIDTDSFGNDVES